MRLGRPAGDLIRSRTSVRKYTKEPLDGATVSELRAFLHENATGPFGGRLRFRVLASEAGGDADPLAGLGTYGFISNPAAFLTGAVSRGERDLEDFGYCMQRAVLYATGLGVATCWLGGTFSRSAFSARIGLREDERLPAVLSMGYSTSRRGLLDRVVRGVAGSHSRRPFGEVFFRGSLGEPLDSDAAGPYAGVLDLVRLAPSASNKQPWRVVLDPRSGAVHFFVFRLPSYQGTLRRLGLDDLPRVDLGIAMCHFDLAAGEAGLHGTWHVVPDMHGQPRAEHTEYTASWLPAG